MKNEEDIQKNSSGRRQLKNDKKKRDELVEVSFDQKMTPIGKKIENNRDDKEEDWEGERNRRKRERKQK